MKDEYDRPLTKYIVRVTFDVEIDLPEGESMDDVTNNLYVEAGADSPADLNWYTKVSAQAKRFNQKKKRSK